MCTAPDSHDRRVAIVAIEERGWQFFTDMRTTKHALDASWKSFLGV